MVREGESLSGALAATRMMPPMALDMIEVGESSGALAPMLNSVAEFYEDEVNVNRSAMVALIEPIMSDFHGNFGGIYFDFTISADFLSLVVGYHEVRELWLSRTNNHT